MQDLDPELLGTDLMQPFADAPDPQLARIALSRVGEDPGAREALARPEVLSVAARLLGFSTAAADFFVGTPTRSAASPTSAPRSAEALDAELATT